MKGGEEQESHQEKVCWGLEQEEGRGQTVKKSGS